MPLLSHRFDLIMKTSQTFSAIAEQISNATKQPFQIQTTKAISGGDINAAFLLEGENQRYFVKLNRVELVEMFAAEFAGLNELAKTQTIRIPKPITFGQTNENSFLVLEFIALRRATSKSDELLPSRFPLTFSSIIISAPASATGAIFKWITFTTTLSVSESSFPSFTTSLNK